MSRSQGGSQAPSSALQLPDNVLESSGIDDDIYSALTISFIWHLQTDMQKVDLGHPKSQLLSRFEQDFKEEENHLIEYILPEKIQNFQFPYIAAPNEMTPYFLYIIRDYLRNIRAKTELQKLKIILDKMIESNKVNYQELEINPWAKEFLKCFFETHSGFSAQTNKLQGIPIADIEIIIRRMKDGKFSHLNAMKLLVDNDIAALKVTIQQLFEAKEIPETAKGIFEQGMIEESNNISTVVAPKILQALAAYRGAKSSPLINQAQQQLSELAMDKRFYKDTAVFILFKESQISFEHRLPAEPNTDFSNRRYERLVRAVSGDKKHNKEAILQEISRLPIAPIANLGNVASKFNHQSTLFKAISFSYFYSFNRDNTLTLEAEYFGIPIRLAGDNGSSFSSAGNELHADDRSIQLVERRTNKGEANTIYIEWHAVLPKEKELTKAVSISGGLNAKPTSASGIDSENSEEEKNENSISSAHSEASDLSENLDIRLGFFTRFTTNHPYLWGSLKWLTLGVVAATVLYFSGCLAAILFLAPVLEKLGTATIAALTPVAGVALATAWHGGKLLVNNVLKSFCKCIARILCCCFVFEDEPDNTAIQPVIALSSSHAQSGRKLAEQGSSQQTTYGNSSVPPSASSDGLSGVELNFRLQGGLSSTLGKFGNAGKGYEKLKTSAADKKSTYTR